jgi:hypothetical protein
LQRDFGQAVAGLDGHGASVDSRQSNGGGGEGDVNAARGGLR